MKETDLFEPVRDFFEEKGYEVAAEVNHCDVVAVRGDEIVIVELKTALNMTLVTQAVKRQRLSDHVYVAIPEPKRRNRKWRDTEAVLKRLGLGLLTIYSSPVRTVATLRLEPAYSSRKNQKKRKALLREIEGRSIQPNSGGSNGRVYTAYRETAVTIACLLQHRGASRPMDLALVTGPATRRILYMNHYGWFERVERGVYRLTEAGRQAISDYPDIARLARTLAADLAKQLE